VLRHVPRPSPGDGFPAELGAVVQRTVLTGERPALEVVHAPDGSWAVGDGAADPNLPGACLVTHMGHVVERNSSVAGLATMPPGHWARRDGPGQPWTVMALVAGDEPLP
jgi:hypothetical protein